MTLNQKPFEGMFLTLRVLIVVIQVLHIFTNSQISFYKVRTESLMTLVIIYINVMKPC